MVWGEGETHQSDHVPHTGFLSPPAPFKCFGRLENVWYQRAEGEAPGTFLPLAVHPEHLLANAGKSGLITSICIRFSWPPWKHALSFIVGGK